MPRMTLCLSFCSKVRRNFHKILLTLEQHQNIKHAREFVSILSLFFSCAAYESILLTAFHERPCAKQTLMSNCPLCHSLNSRTNIVICSIYQIKYISTEQLLFFRKAVRKILSFAAQEKQIVKQTFCTAKL